MIPYIDLHCDTLAEGVELSKENIVSFPERAIDVERLVKAGAKAQFFACYLDQEKSKDPWGDFLAMRDLLGRTLEATDKLKFAANYHDMFFNAHSGAVSAFLAIENGCLVDGDMDKLVDLRNMGVSLITLTWNQANCFGFPHSDKKEEMEKGLAKFGKEAIRVMNDLDIIIDVSHLSDGGFYDVAALSRAPFIASHSNCREIAPHTRNLTDDMIRIIALKGGLMGLNFCPEFLDPTLSKDNSRIDMMCEHILHAINVGGIESIAIGTDFDGISGNLEIDSCEKMPLLFDALKKRGLDETSLEYTAHKNVERIIPRGR